MKLAVRALAVTLLALGATLPAQATGTIPAPPTASGHKFWTGSVCVANGDNTLPIGVSAQAWNNATGTLTLDASNNCVAAGYTPSRRFTVASYSAADSRCVKLTNGYYATYDHWRRWTGDPVNLVAWVNRYYEGCWATSTLRAHWTSTAIGLALGMNAVTSQGYASRVMCTCSAETIAWPSASTDGADLDKVYNGTYIGPY